jgi:hypothetical protein
MVHNIIIRLKRKADRTRQNRYGKTGKHKYNIIFDPIVIIIIIIII